MIGHVVIREHFLAIICDSINGGNFSSWRKLHPGLMAVIPSVYRGQIQVSTLGICLPVHRKTYLRKCGLNSLFMLLLACLYSFAVGIAHDQLIESLFRLPLVVVLDPEGIVPPVSDYD